MNDIAEFHRAKTESEPEFIEVLKKSGKFDSIQQCNREEDLQHKDIKAIAKKTGKLCYFDVKDISPEWQHLGNYNISNDLASWLLYKPKDFENAFFACKLYSVGDEGKFYIIKMKDALEFSYKKSTTKYGPKKTFRLFNAAYCIKQGCGTIL